MAVVDTYDVTSSLAGTDRIIGFRADDSMALFTGAAFDGSTVEFDAGKIAYVDSVNGDDDTGEIGKYNLPFLTPLAAQTAAPSGYTIRLLPGSYTLASPLGKNGVNWHLEPGSTLTADTTLTANISVFSDGGTAMTFAVTGSGALIGGGTSGKTDATVLSVITVSHASSNISIRCRSISQDNVPDSGGGSSPNAVYQTGGTMYVEADTIHCEGDDGYSVWWINGQGYVRAGAITAGGGTSAVASSVTATPTGDFYVTADNISADYVPITSGSSQAEAKMWITAKLIAGSDNAGIAIGGGKIYVNAQKISGCTTNAGDIYGVVRVTSGSLWLDVMKITGTWESGIYVSGGYARITCPHIEDLGHMVRGVRVSSGTLELNQIQAVMAVGDGVLHAGGTSRLMGCRFDTSATASKSPVRLSGSGCILDGCTLEAEGTAKSITAASGQTVTVIGSFSANTSVHANVTISGGNQYMDDLVANSVTAAGGTSTMSALSVTGQSSPLTVDSNGSGSLGFFDTGAQQKPTVTGSTAGNAALQSLISGLATLGLITNSTS